MKRLFLTLLSAAAMVASANAQWKIAGDKIRTPWASKVSVDSVLPEYPRPQLEREQWLNLNGLWHYSITDLSASKPIAHSLGLKREA